VKSPAARKKQKLVTRQVAATETLNVAVIMAAIPGTVERSAPNAVPETLKHINARLQAAIKLLLRAKDQEAALALIDQSLPAIETASLEYLVTRAGLLEYADAFDLSDALFERLVADPEATIELRVDYAKRLRKRGLILRAQVVARRAAADPAARKGTKVFAAELTDQCDLLRRLEPDRLTVDTDARTLALYQAILMFRDRTLRPREPGHLGKLALITGSLAPGGAERQIATIAVNLQNAHVGGHRPSDVIVDQPVEIIVKSIKGAEGDFFAPAVVAAGITITEIDDLPLADATLDPVMADDLQLLLKLLPPPANYGVGRLGKHLADKSIDVASIWQDGASLFAGLAALIAGVPTIQLIFRGLPPSVRRHMYRPEYEDLYRAMAQVPGIQMLCNSQVTAFEYAAWLDLPVARIKVIYNGVPETDAAGSAREEKKYTDFVKRTPDATQTIGGVFRFSTDKRPLLWIKLAALYAKRRPNARFIIVGAGQMLERTQQLATELGIGDRVLYVGNTEAVGYWMTRMDVVLLMSRYEGLPNVLIEAQMAGVMVVSTPAGGASECFIDGETGRLLDEAEKPNLYHACDCIEAMMLTGEARQTAADKAKAHASAKFSVSRMVGEFSQACVRHQEQGSRMVSA